VAFTGCSLYITYLFPINYFDLLYRCVVHLGQWEQIQPVQAPPTPAITNSNQHHHGRHGRAAQQQQQQQQEVYLDYSKK
jgi:hypothetical protein